MGHTETVRGWWIENGHGLLADLGRQWTWVGGRMQVVATGAPNLQPSKAAAEALLWPGEKAVPVCIIEDGGGL